MAKRNSAVRRRPKLRMAAYIRLLRVLPRLRCARLRWAAFGGVRQDEQLLRRARLGGWLSEFGAGPGPVRALYLPRPGARALLCINPHGNRMIAFVIAFPRRFP
jgi:hypothetical protein